MSPAEPGTPRQGFSSRTPVNDNPAKVNYRRGFVTRHQVTGWRFVMRRIASGIALHDTRMLVEPLRTQSRAVLMGAVLLVAGLAGCFVFSLIRPNAQAGSNAVLADRTTAALYVRVGDDLHPVLNLTSARLIADHPVNPVQVKSSELDKFPRGNLIGIPGAPERMVQSDARDAHWTVCDTASGIPGRGARSAGITVIAGPPDNAGSRATGLEADQGILADFPSDRGPSTWLLWDGKRSQIDLSDHAVTSALGLGEDIATPRPIAAGLFNAIPQAPSLQAPAIAGAGTPAAYPVPGPVGAVVSAYELGATGSDASSSLHYYAVLPDGLQPISPVLAALLRNTDSYGLSQPPRLGADQVAKLPVSHALDTSAYPSRSVRLVDATRAPVACTTWSKPAGAATSSQRLLAGSELPVPPGLHTLELVNSGGAAETRVALAPGFGYLAQATEAGASATAGGSLFWISDTGVRYGIDTESPGPGGGKANTVSALGLDAPAVPIPWSVLSLFASGPTLSRSDALLAHDGLPADPKPGRPVAARAPEGESR